MPSSSIPIPASTIASAISRAHGSRSARASPRPRRSCRHAPSPLRPRPMEPWRNSQRRSWPGSGAERSRSCAAAPRHGARPGWRSPPAMSRWPTRRMTSSTGLTTVTWASSRRCATISAGRSTSFARSSVTATLASANFPRYEAPRLKTGRLGLPLELGIAALVERAHQPVPDGKMRAVSAQEVAVVKIVVGYAGQRRRRREEHAAMLVAGVTDGAGNLIVDLVDQQHDGADRQEEMGNQPVGLEKAIIEERVAVVRPYDRRGGHVVPTMDTLIKGFVMDEAMQPVEPCVVERHRRYE